MRMQLVEGNMASMFDDIANTHENSSSAIVARAYPTRLGHCLIQQCACVRQQLFSVLFHSVELSLAHHYMSPLFLLLEQKLL